MFSFILVCRLWCYVSYICACFVELRLDLFIPLCFFFFFFFANVYVHVFLYMNLIRFDAQCIIYLKFYLYTPSLDPYNRYHKC